MVKLITWPRSVRCVRYWESSSGKPCANLPTVDPAPLSSCLETSAIAHLKAAALLVCFYETPQGGEPS